MPDERPLHEVLFEYAVFVPIGIAASVAEQIPGLTEKGRRLASTRINMARLMGQFAVGHAQRRFGHLKSPDEPAAGSGRGDSFGAAPGPPSRHGPDSVTDTGATPVADPFLDDGRSSDAHLDTARAGSPPADPTGSVRPRRPRRASAPGASKRAVPPLVAAAEGAAKEAEGRPAPGIGPVEGAGATPAARPAVDALAIPGYDTLAASQVVQRLSSLEPDELEAIRRYEIGTRGRRTILHRVAQLNAGDGRTTR